MNKILFITNVYPNIDEPFRGIYIQNRVLALNKIGYDSRVIFLDPRNRLTIDDYSVSFSYQHKTSKLNYFGLGKKPIIDNRFFLYINDFKPDLIIFAVTSLWLKRSIISRLWSYSFANFFEGRNADGQYKDHKLYSLLIKNKEFNIYRKMKYLFFCSPLAQHDFEGKFPRIDKRKCYTLINGFDINTFKPVTKHIFDRELIKIISVGNLELAKGHMLLAQVINNVSLSLNKKIIFEIVGTGTQEYINQLSKTINSTNVHYIYKKQLKPDELCAEFQKFDYFILPSYFESFGCVYLEAMSQGLVTVGCKNQGPSLYITDNENGLLVDENSYYDLEKCLLRIINSDIDIDNISNKAIETSKSFGWNKFAVAFKDALSVL